MERAAPVSRVSGLDALETLSARIALGTVGIVRTSGTGIGLGTSFAFETIDTVCAVRLTRTRGTLNRSRISAHRQFSLHSLRHGYASLLIAAGPNVVLVSRPLGNPNANISLHVHAHLFQRAGHAETAREALEASQAATLGRGSNAETLW